MTKNDNRGEEQLNTSSNKQGNIFYLFYMIGNILYDGHANQKIEMDVQWQFLLIKKNMQALDDRFLTIFNLRSASSIVRVALGFLVARTSGTFFATDWLLEQKTAAAVGTLTLTL